jgi:hypothetical protein
LAGASIGVRPLGWALLISYILISIYQVIKMKSSFSKNLIILIGFILFILTFGFYTKSYFGKFIYTSTNGPANFLIGANDNATGGFNSTVFEPGKIGYIQNEESETYIEKGKFYEHKAINWIEHHPVKWIALIPVKLGYIFLWDDYSVSQLMHMQDWNLYVILKHIITTKSLRGLLGNASIAVKVTFFSLLIIHHLYYFLLLFLMIMGIRIMIKNDKLNIDLLLLILVALLILSMTVLVFGAARFKYPIMILLLPFAGFKLSTIKEVKYFNFYK